MRKQVLARTKNTASFWQGKSVFLTGHTGFKGSWLAIWLESLGASVTGYALTPPSEPNLFQLASVEQFITSHLGDVNDGAFLRQTLAAAKPEIVIHMAAQSLVRESYFHPVETYSTNVMGTVNLLEAVRHCPEVRVVINVTTDKCYENSEYNQPLAEDEPLGGHDPYSSSKACSELVTAAWRSSFYPPQEYERHKVTIATARAGNVIGGGDWAKDRLVPDCIRALKADVPIHIRHPRAIRPWQHVLEPLSGYLLLAQRLYEAAESFSGSWNFGPDLADNCPVEWIVKRLCDKWQGQTGVIVESGKHPHEAQFLRLDISKARNLLGWRPRWNIEQALDATIAWHRGQQAGSNIVNLCQSQILAYESNGCL